MDFTKLPSQLIYRTRNSLEEFTNNNEMNECLVDNMLDIYYLQSSNFKERATACFNAAYYICTLILVDKHPEWSLPKYCEIAFCNQKNNLVGQAITLSLVRIYLIHFESDWHGKHKKLVDKLDSFLNSHWIQHGDPFLDDYSYIDAFNNLNSFPVALTPFSPKEFALRVIDKEAIEEMQIANFSWTQFTDYYKYNIMQDIVFHVGKNEDEMTLLVESLRHDAEDFYSKNNPYYESVCNKLAEIEQDIYFHFHGREDEALIEVEIEELQNLGDVRPLQAKIDELEKENAEIKAKHAQQPLETNDEENEELKNIKQQLAEKEKIIKEQQHLIEDYSARFDPKDIKKKPFMAMTGKQHIIFFLAVLAHLKRLPNSRRSMSFLMSFIASRNESTMEDYLGDAISKEECETLAKVFDNEKQPFIADLIRELPEKLEKDKAEKNRNKALKKHNN